MPSNRFSLTGVFLLLALLPLIGGCSSNAINADSKNSFLTSGDLVSMTDQMAASLASSPAVAQLAQPAAQKPMVIVVKPIANETNEIIPPGEKEMYVNRVEMLLASKPALKDRFVFVLNRADYDKLQQQEGLNPGELGTPEDRAQPEYALWGTFYAMTNLTNTNRADTYLCEYRLTKISGQAAGQIIWSGKYETSKHVRKGMLD